MIIEIIVNLYFDFARAWARVSAERKPFMAANREVLSQIRRWVRF